MSEPKNLTVRQLAAELKLTKQTISNYAAQLGIVFETQGNRRIVTPEQADQIRQAFREQHQNQGKPKENTDKKKPVRKAPAEDPATAATIETLRELLQAQGKQLEQERAQHRADLERAQAQHAAQLQAKDGQIEALQSLLSQSQQLQAMQAAQIKALQAPRQDPETEDAATGPDDPEPVPADEDPTPQPEAPQQPEQTTAGPQQAEQPGFWARFKSFFNG